MAWMKVRLSLTKDQKERGVVFSSSLVRPGETEQDNIHEVLVEDPDMNEKIRRLKDVKFFKRMASDMRWRVTEVVRS